MKKYLLTGSSGFIGSFLKKKLINKGYTVEIIPHSILNNPKKLRKIALSFSPHYIIHLAAYGNKYYQDEDQEIIKSNILGTINLLYATKDIRYEAFVNTGSSSEYGIKNNKMIESDSLDADCFYGVTKASATLICRAFAKKYSKPVVTVRPFSVYGPFDDPNKFIQVSIRAFQNNANLKLVEGVHDWIYVDDCINGVLKVIKNVKKLSGKVVNIGTGIQSTNQEVITSLEKIFNKKIKVVEVDRIRDYDTTVSWVADNSLLISLGWRPKYSLLKGLKKTIYEEGKKR